MYMINNSASTTVYQTTIVDIFLKVQSKSKKYQLENVSMSVSELSLNVITKSSPKLLNRLTYNC